MSQNCMVVVMDCMGFLFCLFVCLFVFLFLSFKMDFESVIKF